MLQSIHVTHDQYSRTSTNGHLSTTATSLQRPLFFVPADSPYITSCLNLSTMATSLQRQRPLKYVPNCQNNLSTTATVQLFFVKTKPFLCLRLLEKRRHYVIGLSERVKECKSVNATGIPNGILSKADGNEF